MSCTDDYNKIQYISLCNIADCFNRAGFKTITAKKIHNIFWEPYKQFLVQWNGNYDNSLSISFADRVTKASMQTTTITNSVLRFYMNKTREKPYSITDRAKHPHFICYFVFVAVAKSIYLKLNKNSIEGLYANSIMSNPLNNDLLHELQSIVQDKINSNASETAPHGKLIKDFYLKCTDCTDLLKVLSALILFAYYFDSDYLKTQSGKISTDSLCDEDLYDLIKQGCDEPNITKFINYFQSTTNKNFFEFEIDKYKRPTSPKELNSADLSEDGIKILLSLFDDEKSITKVEKSKRRGSIIIKNREITRLSDIENAMISGYNIRGMWEKLLDEAGLHTYAEQKEFFDSYDDNYLANNIMYYRVIINDYLEHLNYIGSPELS